MNSGAHAMSSASRSLSVFQCSRSSFRLCGFSILLFCFVFVNAEKLVRAAPPAKPLQIYFVDVEGGQATLFVMPAGKSLLIDTGWPGFQGRDADRIVAAAKLGGISKIDYVLLTHYHMDHTGGVPQLLDRIPVGTFIIHGPNREHNDAATVKVWEDFQKAIDAHQVKQIVVKPGDILPIQGIHAEVVSADGVVLQDPLSGAGTPNPACATTEKRDRDTTENARSLGTFLTFERTKILDLGDLTWQKELELVCPNNKLGTVDILVVSHHGWLQSNSQALLDAIAPRIAIMDNSAIKGGSPSSWDIIKHSPRLEDLWQLHYSNEGGPVHNSPEPLLANLKGADTGNYLKVTVDPDGTIAVYNPRTKETKRYNTLPPR
jgi:beta-lactamase superfamily II metal-dependent hydrolase